ncbi:MAG: 16S rRNA (guanine(966)-N(2))-methyltransferase RsmD [Traorella sp.]
MRIIAGKYRSLKLESVEGMNTRPTADRIKEAIFSSIGPYFYGGKMLDCYAGSGNVSLEALSRGMDYVDAFEIDSKACLCIQKNVAKMKVDKQYHLHKKDVLMHLDELKGSYDLIYIDPPYAKQQNEKLMNIISDLKLLSEEGILIVESRKEDVFAEQIGQLKCYKMAYYGITKISYYERVKE